MMEAEITCFSLSYRVLITYRVAFALKTWPNAQWRQQVVLLIHSLPTLDELANQPKPTIMFRLIIFTKMFPWITNDHAPARVSKKLESARQR